MEKGLKNLTQAYRQAQRKQGTYEINEDSGVGISDLEEDLNENPSPVLTDASSQIPMTYQPISGYQPTQPTRVPSIHSILQHHPQPTMMQSQPMPQQTINHPSLQQYTSGYVPHN
jgi:hypothetical protein